MISTAPVLPLRTVLTMAVFSIIGLFGFHQAFEFYRKRSVGGTCRGRSQQLVKYGISVEARKAIPDDLGVPLDQCGDIAIAD